MNQIKQLLIDVLTKMNHWEQNAKSIDELPVASSVVPSAKIHVSEAGTSKALELQKLINASISYFVNQITSIGEITIDGNDVTIPATTWKIANVNYSTSTDTIINVPFSATGTNRIDIIVANTLNQIYKVSGSDTSGIAIRPNQPLNTVIVTEINVTDNSLVAVPFPLNSNQIDAIVNANTPSASNPFATMDDIASSSGLTPYVELNPERDFEIADLSRLLLPTLSGVSSYGVYSIPLNVFSSGNRIEVLAQFDVAFTTVIVMPINVHVIFNGIDYNNDYVFIPQGTKAILINKGGNYWVMTYEVSETRKPFSLEETLMKGRETNGNNILVNDNDAIELENDSLLKKGTNDFGGNGGISQICSVGYEKNWQAGIEYVFDNSGFIRTATNCFNIIPDSSYDNTKKFKVGSRWILDDGTIYICADVTTNAAIWQIAAILFRKDSNVFTLFNIVDQSFEFWDLTVNEDYPINIWSNNSIAANYVTAADSINAGNQIFIAGDGTNTTRIFARYIAYINNLLGKQLQVKAPDSITDNWVQQLPPKSGTFAMTSDIATAITNLKDGVSSPGDTLQKLYNLILGASAEEVVANITERDAYNIPHLPFSLFVIDDGDGRWAKYQATTTGVGATFVKLSDPDLLNAVMSASAIKTAYESNSNTNAFTNALLLKLNSIASGATANSSDAALLNRANHIGTQLAATISDFASQVGTLITIALVSFKTANFLDFTSSGQTQLNSKEDSANKSTSVSLGTSDVLFPTQKAVKTYADNLDDQLIIAQQALGSTVKSIGLGVRNFRDLTGSLALTDGQMRFIAVYLPKSQTITGVKWQQVTQGVYTADNENRVGLYTFSGGTMTLVASSADDGNIWKVASGAVGSKAFSTPYSANSGLYFIGVLWNASAATTPPFLGSGANLLLNNADFTNSAKIGSTYTSATIPTSLAQSATASQLGNLGLFLY